MAPSRREVKKLQHKQQDPQQNPKNAKHQDSDHNIKNATELRINDLLNDPAKKEIEFPETLTSAQRKFVHNYSRKLGMKSKSNGEEPHRTLTVYKTEPKPVKMMKDIQLVLEDDTRRRVYKLLKRQPLTHKEKSDIVTSRESIAPFRISIGTLNHSLISVPPSPANITQEMAQTRMNLPIFSFRQQVIQMIHENRGLVISGETGSGKTTQVPQYILEHCSDNGVPCRIICAQPRRLSAISVAERVCAERGETIGHTIGYQIRLESRTSPSSNLIYCTNGILLRCLMGSKPEEVFKDITHVIVDEVHERDQYSDFLLISLRRALQMNSHLRVILMSATIDCDLFTGYLQCPKIEIPGKIFPVDIFYLEDVLMQVGYRNKKIDEILAGDVDLQGVEETEASSIPVKFQPDDETKKFLDELIEKIFLHGDQDASFQFLVEIEDVDINYRHSDTDISALMAGAAKGMLEFVHELLVRGADPSVTNKKGYTALSLAMKCNQFECAQKIMYAQQNAQPKDDLKAKLKSEKMENILLEGYMSERKSDDIDHKLILKLVMHIHGTQGEGAILIFFPGFADIAEQADQIEANLNAHEYQLFLLHSQMDTKGQRTVFSRLPKGVRKIILSTNIAETSVTIDDVVYVIDAGLVKQQTFDAFSESSCLAVCSISRACAKQRTGRAGRCRAGVCFRMYSKERFNTMSEFTLPELLRVSLTEICIQAKLIAKDMPIGDFLKQAIQPPSELNVAQSIKILQALGALDMKENLTELGARLGDIPVDVRLGKMLIFGILLRCLDPILTIASALSTSDLFMIPMGAEDRAKVYQIRTKLGENAFSDHLVLLRAYQQWSNDRLHRNDKKYCQQNFIRSGTMEMIAGVRSQLLGQLRSTGFVRANGPGNIHDLNHNANNWAAVKACLVAGLYPNICHIDRRKGKLQCASMKRLGIQKNSVIRARDGVECLHLPTEWLIFEEKVRITQHLLASTSTLVTPLTVALIAGPSHMNEKHHLIPVNHMSDDSSDDEPILSGPVKLKIDDWLSFITDANTAYLVFHLRQKFYAQLQNLLHDPRTFFQNTQSNETVHTVATILDSEEKRFGFPILDAIGVPPKAVGLSFPTAYNPPPKPFFQTPPKRLEYHAPNNRQQYQMTPPKPSNNCFFANNNNQQHQQQQHSTYSQPQSRFFIVRAASKQQTILTVRTNSWTFSASVRSEINRIKRQDPHGKIFILFHVPEQKIYCCLTEYTIEKDQYCMRLITEQYITAQTMQNFIRQAGVRRAAEFFDGEEIPEKVASLMFQFLTNC